MTLLGSTDIRVELRPVRYVRGLGDHYDDNSLVIAEGIVGTEKWDHGLSEFPALLSLPRLTSGTTLTGMTPRLTDKDR